jgi:hypothetical protein
MLVLQFESLRARQQNSPSPTSQYLALVVTWLFSLQLIALGAEVIDLVFSIRSNSFSEEALGLPGPLQLPDRALLTLNLTAHVLDLGSNDIVVGHFPSPHSPNCVPKAFTAC